MYDLILHNYGPDVKIGSLHINVYDTMSAHEIHALTRKITTYMFDKYGIMYDVDEVRDNSGTVWYHLRGLGWSMAKYFKEYGKGPEDPLKTWSIGLTREEIETAISYLQQTIMEGDD